MKYQRMIVIGCPGSGKSTFSYRLRDKTGIPLYHLDMIFHRPDRTTIPKEEFDKRLSDILEREQWIIDGNYQRTLPVRFEKCDTVFLFDLPVEECVNGIKERIGRSRDDMPWIESEADDGFLERVLNFRDDKLPAIYELIKKYGALKNIIVFHSRHEADRWLEDGGLT